LSIIFFSIGLRAVFRNHARLELADLYSLHSWIGMTATILYASMYLVGLLAFIFNIWDEVAKAKIVVYHIVGGTITIVFGMMALLTGLLEKATFMSCVNDTHGCRLVNGAGVAIILLTFFLFFYLILNGNKKLSDRRQVEEGAGIELQKQNVVLTSQ
jgi:cytochrome b-561